LSKNELCSLDQYKSAVEGLFPALDDALRKEAGRCSTVRQKHGLPALVERTPTSGCSLVLALVGEHEIVIANVGECKAYVCYSSNPSKAVLISGNHSEVNKEDEARVKAAGGFFSSGRVNGLFPFTRSIGDYALKDNEFINKEQQLMVCTPSVFALRKQDIRMLVLGSSGLWERTNLVLKELTSDDLELG
jgi:serine/threonine protein phosphatase PrpC